jgi:hypothetical protein
MLTPIGRKHTARQPAVHLSTTVTPVVVLAEERNGYIPLGRLPPLRERSRRLGRFRTAYRPAVGVAAPELLLRSGEIRDYGGYPSLRVRNGRRYDLARPDGPVVRVER